MKKWAELLVILDPKMPGAASLKVLSKHNFLFALDFLSFELILLEMTARSARYASFHLIKAIGKCVCLC